MITSVADTSVLSPPKNEFDEKEKRIFKRQTTKNKHYGNLITKESDTIKNLHKLLSPKMGNFYKARRAVEPYDDID